MRHLVPVLLPRHRIPAQDEIVGWHGIPVAESAERPVDTHGSMEPFRGRGHVVGECLEPRHIERGGNRVRERQKALRAPPVQCPPWLGYVFDRTDPGPLPIGGQARERTSEHPAPVLLEGVDPRQRDRPDVATRGCPREQRPYDELVAARCRPDVDDGRRGAMVRHPANEIVRDPPLLFRRGPSGIGPEEAGFVREVLGPRPVDQGHIGVPGRFGPRRREGVDAESQRDAGHRLRRHRSGAAACGDTEAERRHSEPAPCLRHF